MEESIFQIAEQIKQLHKKAYDIYLPLVDDVCRRKVSEMELSYLLDYLLDDVYKRQVYFGEVMLASPNGRLAHKPVSEGISPEKAADVNGPTSVIRSASKMDHLSTGGTLLNQKFTPSVVAGEDGLSNMADLILSLIHILSAFFCYDRKTMWSVCEKVITVTAISLKSSE